jgi:hypothetical protein
MSRVSAAAIGLVARTLPSTIRERHREEWLADVAAAPAAGIHASSIILGAIAFSASLDRSLPVLAGYARPELARRHARWALAIAALTVVVVQSRLWLPVDGAWLLIALLMCALTLSHMWSAARLSSGIARTSAAFITAGLVTFAAASTIPIVVSDAIPGSRYLPTGAAGLLVIGFILGMISWGRPLGAAGIALLSTAAALAFGSSLGVLPGSALLSTSSLTVAALAVVAIVTWRRGRRERPLADLGRRTRIVAVGFASLLLLGIGYEVFIQLVLSPMAKAPGRSLDELYAELPADVLAVGLGDIVIVASASALATVGYLVLFLLNSRRARIGDVHGALAVGAALVALVLLANSSAGLALTLAIGAEFGTHAGSQSDWTLPAVSLGLVVAILAVIAPRSSESRSPLRA